MRNHRVLQMVDSLQIGGMESVAVNLANGFAGRGLSSFLCSTRAGGPLEHRLSHGVGYIGLHRKGLLGLGELGALARFLWAEKIEIIHAHGTSLFVSIMARMFVPKVRVIWHDHFGRYATEERSVMPYRLAVGRCAGVIAVNGPLCAWSRDQLRMATERVWYVPNFVVSPPTSLERAVLPGIEGKRIVCVANLRPEKDHLTLIEAMALVVRAEPEATLFLVGNVTNRACVERVKVRIREGGLNGRVVLLGARTDVWPILRGCDVGVLSSASEGLPLALLEYGMAGLPSIATEVGQIAEVLDHGRVGLLVPPAEPEILARGILRLLGSVELRHKLSADFRGHVDVAYGEASILERIVSIYDAIMKRTSGIVDGDN